MRPRVYISGPITLGNRTMNFANAANMQMQLMEEGFAVFNPMLSILHPDAWNIDHRSWMDNDLPWVAASDVVLRLPGESKGADEETEFAETNVIPVVYSYATLLKWRRAWERARPVGAANGT